VDVEAGFAGGYYMGRIFLYPENFAVSAWLLIGVCS